MIPLFRRLFCRRRRWTKRRAAATIRNVRGLTQ